jgi:hypothetical protein
MDKTTHDDDYDEKLASQFIDIIIKLAEFTRMNNNTQRVSVNVDEVNELKQFYRLFAKNKMDA